MTADEIRTLRAYPRHFDLDGLPIFIADRSSPPQAYSGEGHWETFDSAGRLLVHGKLVTSKRFESLCQNLDRFLDKGVPFLESADA